MLRPTINMHHWLKRPAGLIQSRRFLTLLVVTLLATQLISVLHAAEHAVEGSHEIGQYCSDCAQHAKSKTVLHSQITLTQFTLSRYTPPPFAASAAPETPRFKRPPSRAPPSA